MSGPLLALAPMRTIGLALSISGRVARRAVKDMVGQSEALAFGRRSIVWPFAMTPSQRRANETMEAYVGRLIREDERERCAKIAETFDIDGSLGKLPKGWAGCRRMIAAAIRKAE